MKILDGFNQLLAFLIELAMLAALCYWGFHVSDTLALRLIAGLGAPAIVIAIWGKWLAPRAKQRLEMPGLMILKAVLFGLTAAALYAADKQTWAAIFAVTFVISFCLSAATKHY